MSIQKWKLISTKDVSPNKWFPLEMRTYELPDGRLVDDFTVTTLADVAMVIPVLITGKILLVKQFKPGVDEVMIQFPAGRIESDHADMADTAAHELEEETGIKKDAESLLSVATLGTFPTKATERVHIFLAQQCEFNSTQHFDEHEEIELLQVAPTQLDQMIESGEMWCAQSIAAWELAKKRFLRELQ